VSDSEQPNLDIRDPRRYKAAVFFQTKSVDGPCCRNVTPDLPLILVHNTAYVRY